MPRTTRKKMNDILKEGTQILCFLERFDGKTPDTYEIVKRVYKEQTDIDTNGKRILRSAGDPAMNSVMIQTPFDVDATFRLKAGTMYKGYIANLVEACGGYGSLIISYSVEQNIFSDEAFLQDFLNYYVDKGKLDELCSQDEDQEAQDQEQPQDLSQGKDQNQSQDQTQNPDQDLTQEQTQTQDQTQTQSQEHDQTQTPEQTLECRAGIVELR